MTDPLTPDKNSLTTSAEDLYEQYFDNKMRIEYLTEENKEILEILTSLAVTTPHPEGK